MTLCTVGDLLTSGTALTGVGGVLWVVANRRPPAEELYIVTLWALCVTVAVFSYVAVGGCR